MVKLIGCLKHYNTPQFLYANVRAVVIFVLFVVRKIPSSQHTR